MVASFVDIALLSGSLALTSEQQNRIGNSLSRLGDLKGVRYFGSPTALPLFPIIPTELDYLEIFPSGFGKDGDVWQNLPLSSPVKVETLVLVDREYGRSSGVIHGNSLPTRQPSMVHIGRHQPPTSGAGDDRLKELLEAVTGVERLVLRLNPNKDGGGDRENIPAVRFAINLGDCLSLTGLANVEEIEFQFASRDKISFQKCRSKIHIVRQISLW